MEMIDTHAHLNFEGFEKDYPEVIADSFENNIKAIIMPSSNLKTSNKAVEIAKNYKNTFAAVGLHPIHIGDPNNIQSRGQKEEFNYDAFLKLAQNKNKRGMKTCVSTLLRVKTILSTIRRKLFLFAF